MNIRLKKGNIISILSTDKDITIANVKLADRELRVINHNLLTGPISLGDEVLVNTTAVELELGSGGEGFVAINLDHPEVATYGGGHIMKLRYTPAQFCVASIEEQGSDFHEGLKGFKDLGGLPVVIGELHSQLYACIIGIKSKSPNAKIIYMMTDGAALPIAHSRTVKELKRRDLISETITTGHAFGGDIEAVNIYSGLQAAKVVSKADIVVAIMGPGIVGTGTTLGFSGIEQAQIVNAVISLGGRAIAIPRISFKDKRERHYGLSHHTLTSLGMATLGRATIAFPNLKGDLSKTLMDQVESSGLLDKHDVEKFDATFIIDELKGIESGATTMGRGIDEEPEFFMAAGSAGICAAGMLEFDDR